MHLPVLPFPSWCCASCLCVLRFGVFLRDASRFCAFSMFCVRMIHDSRIIVIVIIIIIIIGVFINIGINTTHLMGGVFLYAAPRRFIRVLLVSSRAPRRSAAAACGCAPPPAPPSGLAGRSGAAAAACRRCRCRREPLPRINACM